MATARNLTAGEIDLARQVFGNSIDYAAVKIHDRAYVFFQPDNSGMTPRGEIYARGCYSEDYSKGNTGFFIHEMTHVWQYQNKILHPIVAVTELQLKHKFNYGAAYEFQLEKGRDLTRYGMEQQAAIIQQYFVWKHEGADVTLHEDVLKNFLKDPAYARQKKFPSPFGSKKLDRGGDSF